MRNKIGYRIVALAVSYITMMSSFSALQAQAQTSNSQSSRSPIQRKDTDNSSFVYIITNPDGPNAVAAYVRNPETGKLKFIASYPTGGNGDPTIPGVSQNSLVKDGSYLYAVNAGSNSISTFAIQKNGALQLIGSPIASGGVSPVSLAIGNGLLYVANQGDPDTQANLNGFTVKNGVLTSIPGSTVNLSFNDEVADVLFNKAGNVLIDTRVNSGIVDSYQVDNSGHLNQATKLGRQFGAFGAAFNPVANQQLFVTLSTLPGDGSYLVSDQGLISPISKVTEFGAGDPCWVAFSNDGTHAWTSNFLANSLSLYEVDPNGALRFVSRDDTGNIGSFSTDIALSSDGKYLYQSKPLPKRSIINVLRVSQLTQNSKNAGLQEVETINLPSDSNPIGLVVVDVTN